MESFLNGAGLVGFIAGLKPGVSLGQPKTMLNKSD